MLFQHKTKKINKEKQKVRIGIDARFFNLENKGLGRYTNELVHWLDRLNQKKRDTLKDSTRIEYYLFMLTKDFKNFQPQAKNIHKVEANFRWYSFAEQIKYPFLLRKYNLDLMHFPHFNVPIFYGRKFMVTIHDLILFHYPTIKNSTLNRFVYWFKLLAYHFSIRLAVKRAFKIIAISEFTKQDIVKTLKVPSEKIVTVLEGAEFVKNSGQKQEMGGEAIFKKYAIMKPYLLYVGNAYPHKNLERLVLAFDQYQAEHNQLKQLVLVGKDDYFYQRLKQFIEGRRIKNIIITKYVSDGELVCFYREAKAFVFPSLYEGFGLPPLEALMYGVPVLSSKATSLPEILGDKVTYFKADSVRSIKLALEKSDFMPKITDKEIEEIKQKYSWQKMSEKTIKIYKKILINNV